MIEKILAVVIPAVIVPLVLIIIGTIYKMKEKSRKGENPIISWRKLWSLI